MKAIVAVDKNWGIGKQNALLFHLKEDMQYFKEKTIGKVVIMGSNTLKSFPGERPLKNRVNIVLYPGGAPRDDCLIVGNMEELKAIVHMYDTNDIFVIGGAMFYKTMLPYCDTVYVTKVDADGEAEVFYENLDKLKNWEMVECGNPIVDNGYTIRFCKYANTSPQEF